MALLPAEIHITVTFDCSQALQQLDSLPECLQPRTQEELDALPPPDVVLVAEAVRQGQAEREREGQLSAPAPTTSVRFTGE